ncbi:MAG: efflux RND transporter periplasmic adaptor subunit [bacterium]
MTSRNYAVFAVALALAGCSTDAKKVELPKQPQTTVEAKATPEQQALAQKSTAERKSLAAEGSSTFTGSIESYRTTDVATNVGGLIRKVYVEEGQHVKEGDPLVDIDPADFRLRLQASEAALNRANAQVAMLTTQFDRAKKLVDKNAITNADYDAISGQLSVARAAVAEAQVGVSMARKMLTDSKIKAPYDAVVTKVNTAEGEYAGVGPAPLVVVTETGRLRARIQLDEHYITSVKVGDPVELRVAATNQTFQGVIERINPSIQPGSRAFAVLTRITTDDPKLRPGMFVEARLNVAGDHL